MISVLELQRAARALTTIDVLWSHTFNVRRLGHRWVPSILHKAPVPSYETRWDWGKAITAKTSLILNCR